MKPKTAIPHKLAPKTIKVTQLPIDTTSTKTEANDKKTLENVNPRLNKKSNSKRLEISINILHRHIILNHKH